MNRFLGNVQCLPFKPTLNVTDHKIWGKNPVILESFNSLIVYIQNIVNLGVWKSTFRNRSNFLKVVQNMHQRCFVSLPLLEFITYCWLLFQITLSFELDQSPHWRCYLGALIGQSIICSFHELNPFLPAGFMCIWIYIYSFSNRHPLYLTRSLKILVHLSKIDNIKYHFSWSILIRANMIICFLLKTAFIFEYLTWVEISTFYALLTIYFNWKINTVDTLTLTSL